MVEELVEETIRLVSKERIQERIVEEIIHLLVLQTLELVHWRSVEEIVDASVPQIQEKINDLGKVIQERVSERVVEHITNIPVSHISHDIVHMIQLVPIEQIGEHIVEEMVDVRVL